MTSSHLKSDIESPESKPTANTNASPLAKFLCLPVPLGVHDPLNVNVQNFPNCASSHACALSTDPSINPLVGVGCLMVAAGITWIKTIMLASIVVDSMTPRCTSNGQCGAGSWCTPLALMGLGGRRWPEVGRENSACFDCHYADLFNATDSLGESFILAGRTFCESRGNDPSSCDFVRSNRARMSVLSAVMLFLCWTLIGKMIHEELKSVHAHLSLFKFRIELLRKQTNKYHIWALQAASWFGQTSRAFIYPTWMACATINLLVSWAPMTRNIILIPVQIGLVANFDNVVIFLLMGPTEIKFIREAAKQMELTYISKTENVQSEENAVEQKRLQYKEMITSSSLRLYAYGLATMIIIFALHPEDIFDHVKFMLDFVGNAPLFAPVAPCDKVYSASLFLPLILSSVAVIPKIVYTAYHDKSKKKSVLFSLICLFHITMTTLFVVYSWVPIASIIYETQFRTL